MTPSESTANNTYALGATFQGAPHLLPADPPPNSSTFGGRCYASVLKNCRRVANCIKFFVKAIFGLLFAIAFILVIAPIGLIGGAIKLASLKSKTNKQPIILDKTREVKGKEHEVKFEAMRAVITTSSFQKYFDEMMHSRPTDDPEIKLIQKFQTFFQNRNDEGQYPRYNKEFIVLLRDELKGPLYQTFIQNLAISPPIAPSLGIKMLQDFSLNIFLGVRAMPYYQELGKTIFTEVQNTLNPPQINTTQDLAPLLHRSLAIVKSTMHTDSGFFGKFAYAMTHRKQTVASLASIGGGKKITRILGKNGQVYDTHKEIANNPSVQGTTIWTGIQNNPVRVDNIFCASPTLGNTAINNELLCVLDTILANNRLPVEKRDHRIPSRLIYTNFQNLAATTGEGARSVVIMSLAQRYPKAFIGITLPKDSDFYLGKNKSWQGLDTIDQFGERMQQHMLADFQRGLENRMENNNNKGHGFYFPVDGSVQWNCVLPAIIASANEFFQRKETLQLHMSAAEKIELRMAYQEFVYSLIQDYLEIEEAKKPDISYMMTITACKEHADRAAAESLKKLYLRWVSQEQLDKNRDECVSLMLSGIHTRALMTRERLVIEHRTEAVLAFMKYVTPEEYNAARSSRNVQVSATFTPTLTKNL